MDSELEPQNLKLEIQKSSLLISLEKQLKAKKRILRETRSTKHRSLNCISMLETNITIQSWDLDRKAKARNRYAAAIKTHELILALENRLLRDISRLEIKIEKLKS